MNFSDEIDQLSNQLDDYELGGMVKYSEYENQSIELFKTE